MLRCGDRRFNVWRRTFDEKEGAEVRRRIAHLDYNHDRITNALDRKKEREDTLFGIRIARGSVVPFIN